MADSHLSGPNLLPTSNQGEEKRTVQMATIYFRMKEDRSTHLLKA